MIHASISWIGELIAETGCDCNGPIGRLEDHTCLAGRAELEWCSLSDERDALKVRVADLEASLRSVAERHGMPMKATAEDCIAWLDESMARLRRIAVRGCADRAAIGEEG